MKSAKLLVALAATGLVATSAFAQKSAFEGFYGQIATGYENNSVSNLNASLADTTSGITDSYNASNQSFGGAPLVIGLGYNFSVAPKWLLGIGVDYSALNQKSSSFGNSGVSSSGNTIGLNGATIEMSNRVNVFITPGYEIDKDKLAYFKAGYSMVSGKFSSPNSFTCSPDCNSDNTSSSGSLPSTSQSKNLNGYVLGLGYKQMIASGLYGFAEFNYMSYAKQTYTGSVDSTSNFSASPSVSSYQALVGVGYKF